MARIGVVRQAYYPEDVRVRREIEALLARDHEVEVLCLQREGEPAHERHGNLAIWRLPLAHRRGGVLRYLFEYVAFFVTASAFLARRELVRHFDVVQVHTMPDFLVFAAWWPKLRGSRIVLDLHEMMPELFAAKYRKPMTHPLIRSLRAVERASARWADRVTTVHKLQRDRVIERCGLEPANVGLALNVPDDRLFGFRESHSRREPSRFVLISHGTIIDRLGYDLIITAVARVRNVIPGIELWIVGEGEQLPGLKAQAEREGVGDRVFFPGYLPIDKVPSIIGSADLGIVANRWDGYANECLPTKLLEYLAVGRPAICARNATVDLYLDSQTVAGFEPENVEDLARAILQLYQDPGRRREMVQRGRHWIETYGWRATQQSYCDFVTNPDLIRQLEAVA